MRSSSPSANSDDRGRDRRVRGANHRVLHLLAVCALVFLCRAPFLLYGDRFFDSDEAVEGLMARHVLEGEYPVFLWGQRYKGVPEVYLAAALFALAGSSVVVLKGVTLGCFALFACVQFVLVERLFSRAIAWLATAFVIVGPPSIVLWSLSANAEIVMTLLSGTTMCLAFDVWRRTGSRRALMIACAALGAGLWVQQFILYYVIALVLAVMYSLPRRTVLFRQLVTGRELPRWVRIGTNAVAFAALGYLVLGAAAFFTGGFDASVFGRRVGIHHAQKLWSIAAGLFVIALLARSHALLARRGRLAWLYAAMLAFAAGYAPALAAQATRGGSPPIGRADLDAVTAALPPLAGQLVPIVLGFRSPTTAPFDVPLWLAVALAVAVAASFVALREQPYTPLFHFLVVTAPLVFLVSGAFVDAQSYRYLMPGFGALAVVLALGVWRLFRWSRVAGAVTMVMLLTLFGLEQRAWYRQLTPDVHSRELIACLELAGVRAAFADYWISYKLTFLTDERIIVAPNNGVDRYPKYTAYVQAQANAPTILDRMRFSCAPESFLSR